MKRMVQIHTIAKENVDNHHDNAQCRSVRNAYGNVASKNFLFRLCDDKNEIKVDPPGKPLELAARRRVRVTKIKYLNIQDYEMSIKSPIILSVDLDINEPMYNKLGSMRDGKALFGKMMHTLRAQSLFNAQLN